MKKNALLPMTTTAVLLAVGMVLPMLLGHTQVLGQAISPLHIPVLIGGLTCGPLWGALLGALLPIVRSLLFGMPPLVPVAIPMAFEMAAYGLLTGLLYPVLVKLLGQQKRLNAMLLALLCAMVAGRLVGGAAKAVVMGLTAKPYGFSAFVQSYFVGTAVGAVIHLIVVPAVVTAVEKAKLSPVWNRLMGR